MSTDTVLRDALEQHLSSITPPPGDVARALREGSARRRRRLAGRAASVLAVAAAAAAVVGLLLAAGANRALTPDLPAVGRLDYSEGLRAYADPGNTIWLGGREFDASELEFLDTDAVATSSGVVYFDDGRPMLLGEDGRVTALVEGPVETHGEWHPTAKADSTTPRVAFATLRDGVATVTVRDLATDEDVASLELECGRCSDLVIDAFDDDAVIFRTGDGTRYWQVGSSMTSAFAGPETRVVDVRNHALLHDGPAPDGYRADRYITIAAPVDAQLTLDGRWILDWSSRLRSTRTSVEDVVLEQGPTKRGALGFWAVDTDGSVLVASLTGKYPRYTVYDCEVPSGRCEELGPLVAEGGDPMFIGVDM